MKLIWWIDHTHTMLSQLILEPTLNENKQLPSNFDIQINSDPKQLRVNPKTELLLKKLHSLTSIAPQIWQAAWTQMLALSHDLWRQIIYNRYLPWGSSAGGPSSGRGSSLWEQIMMPTRQQMLTRQRIRQTNVAFSFHNQKERWQLHYQECLKWKIKRFYQFSNGGWVAINALMEMTLTNSDMTLLRKTGSHLPKLFKVINLHSIARFFFQNPDE